MNNCFTLTELNALESISTLQILRHAYFNIMIRLERAETRLNINPDNKTAQKYKTLYEKQGKEIFNFIERLENNNAI